MNSNDKEILELMSKLDKYLPHYPPGPLYKEHQRRKALYRMEKNELEAIYCLTESHAPGLRLKGIYRSEKMLKSDNLEGRSMHRDYLEFKCVKLPNIENINEMISYIEEMPKEWTIIQLTPMTNPEEEANLVKGKNYTNAIHISVFNCGKDQPKPYLVTAEPPIDKITNEVMELKEELVSIMKANKDVLSPTRKPTTEEMKTNYLKERSNLNLRLKGLVKDMQDSWVGMWRCLFVGKIFEEDEKSFDELLNKIVAKIDRKYVTERTTAILKCLMLSSGQLRSLEVKKVLDVCFPNADNVQLAKRIGLVCRDLSKMRRHPIILVVDESLDMFPWEMLDVLQEQPVTRMPSVLLTYGLFKEHEGSIRNGLKDDIDPDHGKFLINPDLDLVRMEKRLKSFFTYWLPQWSGLVGEKPTADQFKKHIRDCSIFCYSGHGNGCQFFSGDMIQKVRVNSVVCLFGCSSSSYTSLGPNLEMYGTHQMYLLACSPCVVGNLWIVTDLETDLLATYFLSIWLPNKKANHWKHVDKKKWESTGEFVAPSGTPSEFMHEPELLRALPKAKKFVLQYFTKAACVIRGIPVKIAT